MGAYKFRVLLDTEESEEIFRDILISENENFETFYNVILASFDFSGAELGSFYVSNENWDKGHEIAVMDMELTESLEAPLIMAETAIKDLVHSENQRFILVYDFMRMWCFLVELVEHSENELTEPEIAISVGDAPDELSREIDFGGMGMMDSGEELGNDIDDIFSDFEDDDDDFDAMENIDDYDI